MRLISNLGNIKGREPEKENTPDHIDRAISLGYDVLVELKKEDFNNKKMLWYNERAHRLWFSYDPKIYESIHAWKGEFSIIKTRLVNYIMLKKEGEIVVHPDWRVVVSGTPSVGKHLFLSPGYQLPDYSNAVIYLPEEAGPDEYDFTDLKSAYGICSNEIEGYKKLVEENR